MAIIKLSEVPEITEQTGSEKILVNIDGETKQIGIDKVSTAGSSGSKRIFVSSDIDGGMDAETFVTAIEEGTEIWVSEWNSKIIAYTWASGTGSTRFIMGAYVSVSGSNSPTATASLKTIFLSYTSDSTLISRLNAATAVS